MLLGQNLGSQEWSPIFVSYAQNFEDVALWRALKHVRNGLYVDLGAQHPVQDSVTRAFYERGWRGVHVEPVAVYADLLRADRPDETVIQKAIGAEAGTMTLYVFADSGLSSLIAESAEAGAVTLKRTAEAVDVSVITLDQLLAPYEGRDIHFMKIDIEGAEKAALSGWSPARFRPWIILVEATKPNSTEPNHHDWEPLILAGDYEFAYFDGLNRFYVAKEHPELLDPIRRPPSVFDNFTQHRVFKLEQALARERNRVRLLPEAFLTRLGRKLRRVIKGGAS